MTSTPVISIVTPCFNAGRTLEDTIRSVLDQNYPRLDYIVADGGSADSSAAVLKKYEDRLSRWWSAPDSGQYDAINRGLAVASGEIMGWLNADDMLLPRSLHLVGEIFEAFPQIEWISTLKPGIWDADGYLENTLRLPGFSRTAFLDGLYLPGTKHGRHWIQQESTFWRRSLWERAGARIPDAFSLAGDFALWSLFFDHATLYGVDYPLAGFRMLAGQRSEDRAAYNEQATQALDSARARNAWRPDARRSLRYIPRIRKVARVDAALTRAVGYEGVKIAKPDIKRPGSPWTMVSHRFLP